MPTEPRPVSVADVVHRAVEACDPGGSSETLADLLARYEDRDEPASSLTDIEADLSEAARAIDLDGGDPALRMAVAVATYLAHRRDQLELPRDDVLRLAARAEFPDGPPDDVAGWLAREGVAA